MNIPALKHLLAAFIFETRIFFKKTICVLIQCWTHKDLLDPLGE